MKVFIGIPLPEAVIQVLLTGLAPYVQLDTPIRWVSKQNIHLTLKFMGEMDSHNLDRLKIALAEVGSEIQPFSLTISGLGQFGRGNDLRIFWAGVAESSCLTQLHGKIESVTRRFDIPADPRPFKPHITLGRNKRSHNFSRLHDYLRNDQDFHFGEFSVTSFFLYNSRLTPDGPIYTVVKEIKIGQQ